MWNFKPSDPVFMDVETQSAANLRAVGGKAYIRDASTRLLSAVFRCDGLTVVWVPNGRTPPGCDLQHHTYALHIGDDVPPVVQRWVANGCTFVAHNAEGFDAEFWQHHIGLPVPWCDTVHLCRHAGLPAGLDAASKAIGGTGKSDDAAMRLLTTAKVKAGRVVYPVGTAPLWQKLIRYNIDDVLALEHLYNYVQRVPMTELERRTLNLSQCINEKGVHIDLPFARRLRDAWSEARQESIDRIAALTDGKLTADNIGSVKQVRAYLQSLGFDPGSLDKRTVDQILEHPDKFIDDPECDAAQLTLALLAERQQAVRSTVGKLDRLFKVVDPDHAVRNSIVYYGAQTTGRFSGRDLQPHNFPRGVAFDVERVAAEPALLPAVKQVAAELGGKAKTKKDERDASVANVLGTMTRAVIRARPGHKLVIADFAAVEARCVAWLARCDSMLATLSNPKADIYCDMASKLYGRSITPKDKDERFIGKQIVLGCGYQMGAAKFDAGCKVFLIDLAKANTTAHECVEAYRKGYPEIPALWRAYHDAAMYTVRTGRAVNAGRCVFDMQGSWLCITLPSGRVLRYRDAAIEEHPPKWNPQGPPMPGVWYSSGYGYRKSLYGGIITENISQAHCRDLLCSDLVALSDKYSAVLHVHDEGVWEVEEQQAEQALDEACRVMSTAPPWSAGFPIGVEGFVSTHYVKTPPPGAPHRKYLNSAQV